MTQCTYGNGLQDTRDYDLQGRLTSQSLAAGQTTIDERAYTYDKNSNVLGIDTNHEDNTYQYDRLDRITSDTIDTNTPFSFGYDSNDNRKTKSTTDMASTLAYLTGTNRLTVLDTLLQSKAQPLTPIPGRALSYNDVGRLYELIEEQQLKAAYVYNDMGQRTYKTVYEDGNDTTTIYHYDLRGMLISETTETGQLIKDYLYNGMTPVAQIDNTSSIIPVEVGNHETITYLHPDHLMTARLATNQSQQIIWRWEGEVFGNTPAQEFTNISINHRFPGQYFDSETNLHYNWNRYYDPTLGRYITSDPIGLDGGMNTYNYASANAVGFIDPKGLCPTTIDTAWRVIKQVKEKTWRIIYYSQDQWKFTGVLLDGSCGSDGCLEKKPEWTTCTYSVNLIVKTRTREYNKLTKEDSGWGQYGEPAVGRSQQFTISYNCKTGEWRK